jgi:hypothetical protein
MARRQLPILSTAAAALLLVFSSSSLAQTRSPLPPAEPGREVRLIPAPFHIAADVDRSAELFSKAANMAPAVLATASQSYSRNGIRFFFYDDPVVTRQATELGVVLGQALASFGEAIKKDMVKVVQDSTGKR